MMRSSMLTFAVVSACSLWATNLPAQVKVRTDAVTGAHYVTVFDDDLHPVEMKVVSPNRVDASLTSRVTPTSSGKLRYDIDVAVSARTTQKLFDIKVPCPNEAQPSQLRVADGGSTWHAKVASRYAGPECTFVPSRLVAPDSFTISFESSHLPAFTFARLLGDVGETDSWPTSDPIEENEAAAALIQSLTGLTGGWKEVRIVAPLRDPAKFADLESVTAALSADLRLACGAEALITNPGICRSLEAKLAAMLSATKRGVPAATPILRAFKAELDAQRGKHISEAAYAVLATMATRALHP